MNNNVILTQNKEDFNSKSDPFNINFNFDNKQDKDLGFTNGNEVDNNVNIYDLIDFD